ncbi:MAG: HEAT repeat domain-containing protein [Isosphaeraceae bacterium]
MGISPIPGTSTTERIRLAVGAAQALNAIGPGAAAAIPELARLATSGPDESIAAAAVHTLGGIGETAVPALIKLVHDEGWEIRIGALNALGRVGQKAAAAIPELVRALSDPDEEIRAAAAETLGDIGTGPDGAAAIPALLNVLSDWDKTVRVNAVVALGRIGPRSERVIPALGAAMTGADRGLRSSASLSLDRIGAPAVPALLAMLGTDDKDLSDEVAHTLAEIAAGGGLSSPKGETPEQARVRLKTVRSAVFAALQDPDNRIRDGTARALGYAGKDLVPELIAALGHTSALVRLQAARALGFIGEEASTALDALRQRLHDHDPAVQAAAEAAIKAIHQAEP